MNYPDRYDPDDPDKLLLAPNVYGVLDVPRAGTAGPSSAEPRNDENLILAQLHMAVIQFDDRWSTMSSQGMRKEWVFETARRLARWHYQWAVIHDFLPRFVGTCLVGPTGRCTRRSRKATGHHPDLLQAHQPDGRPSCRSSSPSLPTVRRQHHSALLRRQPDNIGSGGVPIFGPDGGFNLNGGSPIPPDLVMG